MEYVYIKDRVLTIDWQIMKANSNAAEDLPSNKKAYLICGDKVYQLTITDVSKGKIRLKITSDQTKASGADLVDITQGECSIKLVWDKNWSLVSDGCGMIENTERIAKCIGSFIRHPHNSVKCHPSIDSAPMERGVAKSERDGAFYISDVRLEACVEHLEFTDRVATYGYDGMSAYEIAVKHGFAGSEEQWLASLKGAKGDKGEQGTQGAQGSMEDAMKMVSKSPIISNASDVRDADGKAYDGFCRTNTSTKYLPFEVGKQYGVLMNLLDDAENGRGVQFFVAVVGDYKGKVFKRVFNNMYKGTSSFTDWELLGGGADMNKSVCLDNYMQEDDVAPYGFRYVDANGEDYVMALTSSEDNRWLFTTDYETFHVFCSTDDGFSYIYDVEKSELTEEETNAFLKLVSDNKVDKETGKSLISDVFAQSLLYATIYGHEFSVVLKAPDFILSNGVSLKDAYASKVDKVNGKGLISNDFINSIQQATPYGHSFKVAMAAPDFLISNGTSAAMSLKNAVNSKVDKVQGEGLINSLVASKLEVTTISNADNTMEEEVISVDSNDLYVTGVGAIGQELNKRVKSNTDTFKIGNGIGYIEKTGYDVNVVGGESVSLSDSANGDYIHVNPLGIALHTKGENKKATYNGKEIATKEDITGASESGNLEVGDLVMSSKDKKLGYLGGGLATSKPIATKLGDKIKFGDGDGRQIPLYYCSSYTENTTAEVVSGYEDGNEITARNGFYFVVWPSQYAETQIPTITYSRKHGGLLDSSLNGKVDKVSGKCLINENLALQIQYAGAGRINMYGIVSLNDKEIATKDLLSTNDYTDADKAKVATIDNKVDKSEISHYSETDLSAEIKLNDLDYVRVSNSNVYAKGNESVELSNSMGSSVNITPLEVAITTTTGTKAKYNGNEIATTNQLDNKVDKITGKGLSTNDYTNEDKAKVAAIEVGTTESGNLSTGALKISNDAAILANTGTFITSNPIHTKLGDKIKFNFPSSCHLCYCEEYVEGQSVDYHNDYVNNTEIEAKDGYYCAYEFVAFLEPSINEITYSHYKCTAMENKIAQLEARIAALEG